MIKPIFLIHRKEEVSDGPNGRRIVVLIHTIKEPKEAKDALTCHGAQNVVYRGIGGQTYHFDFCVPDLKAFWTGVGRDPDFHVVT